MLLLVLDVLPVGDGTGSDDVIVDFLSDDAALPGFDGGKFLGVLPPPF